MKTKTVKGYKVMNPDMTCKGFQYKVGETYKHDGEIIQCVSGFHFCKELKDCYNYYHFDYKNIVCEVVGSGSVITEGNKTVCSEIKIVKKLELHEVLEALNLFCSGNKGSWNEGSGNEGSGNEGSGNVGSWNEGSENVGSWNVGSWNVGSWNVGSENVGSENKGSGNVGSGNEGSGNEGSRNKGSWNVGSGNKGSGNEGTLNFGSYTVGVLNYHSFIGEKDNCCCFNTKTGMSLSSFRKQYLSVLREIKEWDFTNVHTLPGYTEKKWDLIKKHL